MCPRQTNGRYAPGDALQPAVETPVHDSPLAQRVREEGATLFQGFSFERPSLLQRRRSRPRQKPVEDCFLGMEFSTEAESAVKTFSIVDSVFGDGAETAAANISDDGVATRPSPIELGQLQWFDLPPPDDCPAPRSITPTDYTSIEDELSGGERLKQGAATAGRRPKVSAHRLALQDSVRDFISGRAQCLHLIHKTPHCFDIRFALDEALCICASSRFELIVCRAASRSWSRLRCR